MRDRERVLCCQWEWMLCCTGTVRWMSSAALLAGAEDLLKTRHTYLHTFTQAEFIFIQAEHVCWSMHSTHTWDMLDLSLSHTRTRSSPDSDFPSFRLPIHLTSCYPHFPSLPPLIHQVKTQTPHTYTLINTHLPSCVVSSFYPIMGSFAYNGISLVQNPAPHSCIINIGFLYELFELAKFWVNRLTMERQKSLKFH